jgi:hypothetical protein
MAVGIFPRPHYREVAIDSSLHHLPVNIWVTVFRNTDEPSLRLVTSYEVLEALLSSTLRILYRVAERFHESFAEGGWNFHVIPVVPGH